MIEDDISHFSRIPVFLWVFEQASEKENKDYYHKLRVSLLEKFAAKLAIKPTDEVPFWRFTNFVCGTNGIYRWFYNGANTGHLPSQLSGSVIFYCWWGFEGTEKTKTIFSAIAGSFPLSAEGEKIYCDFSTTRKQNPKFQHSEKHGYAWDTFELLCRLAAESY